MMAIESSRGGKGKRSMKARKRNAFTLVEMLIVVAIIGILVALVSGAVFQSQGDARLTVCAGQMGNIGKAFQVAQSNKVRLTTSSSAGTTKTWAELLIPFVDEEVDVFICPTDVNGIDLDDEDIVLNPSYGINGRHHRMGDGDSDRIVLIDYSKPVVDVFGENPNDFDINAEPGSAESWAQYTPMERHAGEVNALFYAGHVQPFYFSDIDPLDCETNFRLWQPYADEAAGRDCDDPPADP